MTLAEMEQGLALIVQDPDLEQYFGQMLNDAILEVALDFDLPALRLLTPHTFPVNTGNWIWDLPESFHKKLFRCADGDWNPVKVCRSVKALDDLDIDHDETGDRVTHVAVVDSGVAKRLLIYPLANDTLRLWFYEKPNYLEKPGDVPTCIPVEFHERVIFPRVIIKNFQLLQDMIENLDMKSLAYWEAKLREGLFGAPMAGIGLINFLAKAKGGPRRHGGRDPLP